MRLAVLFLALAVLSPVSQAHGETTDCKPSIYSGSNAALLTGRYLDMAKDNAVLSWGARVTASIGPGYAIWLNAKEKSFSCVKQGRLYKCTASARPCYGS